MKNNESEDESEQKMNVVPFEVAVLEDLASHHERMKELENRVRSLESEIMALQRGDNTGFRHPDDGGWFD